MAACFRISLPAVLIGLLAAAAPAAETAAAIPAQEAAQPSEQPARQAETARAPRPRGYDYGNIDWAARRERFAGMQETGFNLMMGGVGAGAGGVALMIYGVNRMNAERDSDPYGRNQGSDGLLPFFVGYISTLVAFPALLTTGIIINRIGNHKRAHAEEMLGGGARLRFDLEPDALKLSYSF